MFKREREPKTLWRVRKPYTTENAIDRKWKEKKRYLTGKQFMELLEAGYDLIPA